MAFVQADRVQETTTSTGAGSVTLAGAVTGFRRFQDVMATSDTCWYVITDPSGPWEIGYGTLTAATTLARTTLIASSTGSFLTLAAGTKQVYMAALASRYGMFPGDEYLDGHTAIVGEDVERHRYTSTAAAAGADLFFRAHGTFAVPTAVVSGDAIGFGLYGFAHDGTDFVPVAYTKLEVDGTVSTGIVPARWSLHLMDDAGAMWVPIDVRSSGDVVVDGIWKNLWANGIFIDGAWNAFGGNMNYPTIAALRESMGISGTGATGTIHLETLDRSSKLITANSTANFTINMRGNSSYTLDQTMAVGDRVSFTLLVTNGTTAYYPTAINIDGSAASVKWSGGLAPVAGTPSAIDQYTFDVIKTASGTFTVLGSFGVYA